MTSKKSQTDPMFPPPPRLRDDTLPDGLDATTDPAPAVMVETTEAAPVGAGDGRSEGAATDPGVPPGQPGDMDGASVDDVLRNMRGPRLWSPPAAAGAESKGADFAAYHAAGAAVPKRHDTPAIGERVVVDLTLPSPPPEVDEPAPPTSAGRPGDELAVLVQEAQRGGGLAREANGDASAPTVVRRARGRGGLAVFAATLLIVLVVGSVALWGGTTRAVEVRADVSARPAAASITIATASPATALSPAPMASSEPSAPSATTTQARPPVTVAPQGPAAPSLSAARVPVAATAARTASAPTAPSSKSAKPSAGTAAPPSPAPAKTAPTSPTTPEPKHLPKNDLPRSL